MTTSAALPSAEELAGRIFSSLVGALDLFTIFVGDQLGFYKALAEGAATSAQLAERAGTAERYTREWLEQQAVTGILTVDDPGKQANARVFSLPAEYRDLFANPNSLMSMAPAAQIFVGAVKPVAKLLEAFRTGDGVPYEDYGADLAVGQANFNRPMLLNRFVQEFMPAMPDIHARLQSAEPARVADIGMGLGWSSIALAKGYPNVRVDGYDLDELSVGLARETASAEGVSDRVTFHVRNAGDAELSGKYDFALAVECIHDMADPVSALAAMRRLVGPGGTVLVVDERTDDAFRPMGGEIEREFYGFSVLHCLPVGMVDRPSAQTGTVMRPATFRDYAARAGFTKVEILPVEYDFFNFYRLTA
jgi:2-polyprenyl-3-methyl-5-hydroxy-6-metoxy-1,4-benzoquinol methylase